MNFYRSKAFWVAFTLTFPVLLLATIHGIKVMTSVFNTDFGNGLVKYADEYVESGRWVFDCKYSRLINRDPLPAPVAELEKANKLTIGSMYINKADKAIAKAVIRNVTATPGWYNNLRYVYSGLDESSNVSGHLFDLLTTYEGRTWGVKVRQSTRSRTESSFKITAEPYDPETYVDYAKAMRDALKSCPVPQ